MLWFLFLRYATCERQEESRDMSEARPVTVIQSDITADREEASIDRMTTNRAGERLPLKATVAFGIRCFSRCVVNIGTTIRRE